MLKVEINNEVYNVCEKWEDLTLTGMSELGSLVTSSPEWVPKFHNSNIEVENEEYLLFITFTRKAAVILSDIPIEVVYNIKRSDIQSLYMTYFTRFIDGCVNSPDYKVKGIEKFSFKGNDYYLPLCDKDVSGNLMPCVNITALELSESTDLRNASNQMSGGNFIFASNVISILCRPKGEKYDENICKQRAKTFVDLPMNIVLEVFFCLEQLTVISQQNTQISTLREKLL